MTAIIFSLIITLLIYAAYNIGFEVGLWAVGIVYYIHNTANDSSLGGDGLWTDPNDETQFVMIFESKISAYWYIFRWLFNDKNCKLVRILTVTDRNDPSIIEKGHSHD